MPKMFRLVAAFALAALLGACAFGNTVDYTARPPALDIQSVDAVTVGVHDQRSYVLSGDKTPQFVGLQRGGYGNPFGVHTTSGKPFADEMASAVVRALTAKGATATPVALSSSMKRADALQALAAPGNAKRLLITMIEWKSDIYANLAVDFNLRAEVFDAAGNPLGQNAISGKETLGMFLNIYEVYNEVLPAFQKRKLEELLNQPAIVQALARPPAPSTAAPAPRRPGS